MDSCGVAETELDIACGTVAMVSYRRQHRLKDYCQPDTYGCSSKRRNVSAEEGCLGIGSVLTVRFQNTRSI